jgi:DNA invertase Pin-like site-specific DNA recombinase
MKAAVYLRQSQDLQDDRLAITRQRPPCLDLCAGRGWTDIVEYIDNDKSASKGERPAYQRMIADIEAGKIQAVVSLDLDRLYRQPVELEHLIDLAEGPRGLLLATCGGDADLATDSGRLFARIKAAVAKAEMERKSARQKLAFQQRAESGIPWSNHRPFGYTMDFEPHPTEAALVRDAYADVLAGISRRSIARRWAEQGVKTTVGNEWTGGTLSDFLRHPRNAGHRTYLGEIVHRHAWAPLVDEATWVAVHAILSDPALNFRPGTRARKYLLTGIALCGVCEKPIRTGLSRKLPVYACRETGCGKIGRHLGKVDDLIESLIVARLSKSDAKELLINRTVVNLDQIRKDAAHAAAKLDEMAADFAEDLITREQLRTGTAKLRAQIAACDAAVVDSQQARIFDGLIGVPDVAAAWTEIRDGSDGLSRCRAVVSALIEIRINPTPRGRHFHAEAIGVKWKR